MRDFYSLSLFFLISTCIDKHNWGEEKKSNTFNAANDLVDRENIYMKKISQE